MEAEQDRLQRLYAEMGDEHLLNMAAQPEDLTADARLALDAELHRRKLRVHAQAPLREGVDGRVSMATDDSNERAYAFGAGIPGVVPAGGSAVEMALEPGGEVRQGMAALLSLYDGHELTRACEELEAARVEFAIEEIAGDAAMGTPSRYEIWVEPRQQVRARDVLREKLELFPPAEISAGSASLVPDGDLVVGQFDAAEAHQVRAMLVEEGFAAKLENDDTDPTLSLVLVPAREQERALAVLANKLGL